MPAHMQWDNDEKTVLLHIYEGDLSIEDYHRMIDKSYEWVSAQPHTVHIVMIRTGVHSQPASLISVMRYANKHLPPNQGLRIIVGGNRLTNVLTDIGQTLTRDLFKGLYIAKDLDDARQYIAEYDAQKDDTQEI